MESFSDHENEIKLLLEEMAKNPKSKAFIRLGNIYIKLEMYNEALDVVKEGLRYSPDNVSGLVILAKCQREKKNLLEAVKLFEKVLSIDPQHIVSMLSLAEIKKRQGDLENAYKLFDNVLFLDPSNEDVKKELKVIKRQIDDIKAEKERIEMMKKRLDEQSESSADEPQDRDEKKYVDEFIIQHSSSVINFDEDEKSERKDADEKTQPEKEPEKKEEKDAKDIEKAEVAEKEEEAEKQPEMLDESAYINPEVDPYLEKEKKDDAPFIPYELPGEKKFMFYSQEMAAIYAEQEQYEKAVEVYQMILRQNPQDEGAAEKIRDLRELMAKREFNLEAFKEKEEKKKQSRTEFIDRLNQSLSVEDATEDELKKAESKFGIEGASEDKSEEKRADKNEMTDEERALMEKYGSSPKQEDEAEKAEEPEKMEAEKTVEEKPAPKAEEKEQIKEEAKKEKDKEKKKEKETKKVFADIDRIKDIPNIPKASKQNEEPAKEEEKEEPQSSGGTGGKQDFSEWLKNVNKFNKDKK